MHSLSVTKRPYLCAWFIALVAVGMTRCEGTRSFEVPGDAVDTPIQLDVAIDGDSQLADSSSPDNLTDVPLQDSAPLTSDVSNDDDVSSGGDVSNDGSSVDSSFTDSRGDLVGIDTSDADSGQTNDPSETISIDSIAEWGNGKAYFFAGASYIRYDLAGDTADSGYPKTIADLWSGLFAEDIDAALRLNDKAWFFSGGLVTRYDVVGDTAENGYPRPLVDDWPGLWAEGVDAALSLGDGVVHFFHGAETMRFDATTRSALDDGPRPIADVFPGIPVELDAAMATTSERAYFFRDDLYWRWDLDPGGVADGYPREIRFFWPGLWDPHEGTGDFGDRLDQDLWPTLIARPDADEEAARRARVAASLGDTYEDLSADYPQYLASIEERLGVFGCAILRRTAEPNVHRFRCATNQDGPAPLDIEPYTIDHINWRTASYHVDQVSQGDFSAGAGTPLSIFATDDDTFAVVRVSANAPTGSILGGLNVRVGFNTAGQWHEIGFSHLNDHVPAYVLEAAETGEVLPVGTVFGFIGYTGNLWIAAPPEVDGPYSGTGGGLPVSHSHIWFVESPENHMGLADWARRALDYTGTYMYGGG